MPTVETVRWRADSPRSSCSRSTAPHTAASLASGSPIPMNTTLLTRRPPSRARRAARTTCSTISPVVRWRVKPACPVAQNPQPIAQPAWLETHTVARSGYSISTVSMRAPPSSSQRNLTVSPASLTDSVTGTSDAGKASATRARSAFGQVRHLLGRREVRVEPGPHLVGAVARDVGEQGAEGGAIDAVALERRHAGATSRVKARSVRWTGKPRCSYIVTAAVLPPST